MSERQLDVSNRRLLKLAEHLDTIPVEAFNIHHWVSLNEKDTVWAPEVKKLEQYDSISEGVLANVECGFAACAVGHASSIKEFQQEGFRMLHDEEFGPIYPSYRGRHSFAAVNLFFGLDDEEAQMLFQSTGYGTRNVTPYDVAKQIRTFVNTRTEYNGEY